MSVVVRIRRSVRAVHLHSGWMRVILCSAVALVVAVGLLDGAAQGWVGMLSVVAALFASIDANRFPQKVAIVAVARDGSF